MTGPVGEYPYLPYRPTSRKEVFTEFSPLLLASSSFSSISSKEVGKVGEVGNAQRQSLISAPYVSPSSKEDRSRVTRRGGGALSAAVEPAANIGKRLMQARSQLRPTPERYPGALGRLGWPRDVCGRLRRFGGDDLLTTSP